MSAGGKKHILKNVNQLCFIIEHETLFVYFKILSVSIFSFRLYFCVSEFLFLAFLPCHV